MARRRELLLGMVSLGAIGCGAPEGMRVDTTRSYGQGLSPVTFVGTDSGPWRITSMTAVRGPGLAGAPSLDMRAGIARPEDASFCLHGVAGHARYVERAERGALEAASPGLGRSEATRAALIPIRKSPEWWAMAQDERRAIFEGESRHIADSMAYLPRVARRLFHARDLGEPFDFLTYFEFAPEHTSAFDELVAMLRSRREWTFVEREVDIRLAR